ncbi:MAG: aminoglycoside phosphotransferase family protein [Candidatus Omnitrophota bacterium]|jgi:hypothetical protein
MTSHRDDELKTQITALLKGMSVVKIERLPASGNNRLYLVDSGSERFVAKHYFTHPEDKRDRLHAEFSFLSFANKNRIGHLPRPIARDDKNNLAIYSFVKGIQPSGSDVTGAAVKAALDFLTELNRHRDAAEDDLPFAAESCFSIHSHIQLVENRVKRLSAIKDAHARKFVEKNLVPAWKKIKGEMITEASRTGTRMEEELLPDERIISPSDFGFHNSVIGDDGRFYFFDFEYAGWDDPAKTVGDFFSHLALPVPVENLGMFARGVAGLTSDPSKTLLRIGLLLRLYRIKWCCIALNHFVSMDSERRRFAENDVEKTKEEQLAKTRKLLDSMETLSGAWRGLH